MIDMGALAERYTANYLRKKNYKLLDYNYRSRYGEVDLILTKGRYIVFVEVKARNCNSIAEPKEFVDEYKQERIIHTAMTYIQRSGSELQPRFDVAEVFFENNEIKSIKYLENAFTLD